MAFISFEVSEKSNIWGKNVISGFGIHLLCTLLLAFWLIYLKVVLDPLWVEALGNHDDSSLHVEAQSHLGTALVVLPPNGYKQLILQQGRTFQIHPKAKSNIFMFGKSKGFGQMNKVAVPHNRLRCRTWICLDLIYPVNH